MFTFGCLLVYISAPITECTLTVLKKLSFAKHRERKNRKTKKKMRMDTGGSGDDSSSSSEDEKTLDEANLPTDEEMDRLEERLECAQSEQKNLFLIVFQRYVS